MLVQQVKCEKTHASTPREFTAQPAPDDPMKIGIYGPEGKIVLGGRAGGLRPAVRLSIPIDNNRVFATLLKTNFAELLIA